MRRLPLRVRIWAPLALVAALTLAALAGPSATAWRCYVLHTEGERVTTRVVAKDPTVALVLAIESGPSAGSHCTADTSDAHFAAAEPGDVLEAVLPAQRPGTCILVATLESSKALLLAFGGTVVALLLLLVLAGLFLQRTFTQPGRLTTRFDLPGGGMACPRCASPMAEGYLPLLAGIHWRAPGEPVGLPHAFGGLPGTVGMRGRPCVHAYHCPKCEIVSFRYGGRSR